jgi:hypothetical protein
MSMALLIWVLRAPGKEERLQEHRFSRRDFSYGTLLAGAVPAGGFGSTPSLSGLDHKSPNERLNIGAVEAGVRGSASRSEI